ncbi:MAG: T9SS type A sorting domain-containing protein [Sphingobacteriales bacterium]|nr:T9SS type A sorting domain-containing protein [Sphingobacteriales bacterium]
MIWNISNLPLFTTKNITVNFLASSSLASNDVLTSFANIYNAQTDVTPTNNQYTLTDIVRASYDPNNKEVDKIILSPAEATQSPYLYYTIHFQNVGNDTAFDISIRDTLDTNLDWTTFQPITSSHKYSLDQTNNKYVLFGFKSIKLPDSTVNEKASHGFIFYKIKPKNTLVVGNSILNKASIVFDVNTPIVTNNAKTVVIQAYAGRDTSICSGQSITLTASGASSYIWSTGANTASITVSPATTSSYVVTGMVNNISQNDTVVVFINPAKTTNRAQTVCQGQIYNFNGTNLSIAGIYRDTLQQVNGCDSFIVLTLNVNPAKTTNRTQIICQGQSYNFNGTNLSTAGIYRDTLQQVNGCDSFIVLSLNVNPTKTTNRAQTVCQGQSYNFNGTNLSTAGIYRDTLQQVNGCDSFIVLTLNVNPTKTTNRAQTVCEGQIYNFNGTNLSIAGIYRDTLQQVNGCDSFIVLTLNVNPAKTTNRAQIICQGQIYNFNGTNLSTAGIYRDTLQQVNGCDSFIVLTLNVNPAKTTNRAQTICEGQIYNFNGTNLSTAGIYRDTLQQVNGCDSIVVLTLNINLAKTTNHEQTVCEGQIYNFNGTNLSTAGIYRDTLQQVNGCDSFIVFTLNINPTKTTNVEQVILSGLNYTFNGMNLSNSGIYRDTLLQSNGCDSFIILTLSVITSIKNNISFVDKIEVFPNPADDFVTVQLKSKKAAEFRILLITIDGKIIVSREYVNTTIINDEISLKNYSSGVYFLQIESENEQATYQLIKN